MRVAQPEPQVPVRLQPVLELAWLEQQQVLARFPQPEQVQLGPAAPGMATLAHRELALPRRQPAWLPRAWLRTVGRAPDAGP